VIPASFDYACPKTVAEAVSLLGQNPEAKILAGGHSLIPMMRFRMATPAMLVDINRLEGLSYIKEEGDWLEIGAMTRESELDRSELVRKSYSLLADTTRVIADPLVRNLATVGGNIAHADPANDHPATMLPRSRLRRSPARKPSLPPRETGLAGLAGAARVPR